MVSPFSRRAPWPWTIELDVGDGTGWHGLMLTPTQEGLLTGKLTEFLGQVTPTSYEYGAARPDEETTFVFGRLVDGMGEWVQASADSKRYRYAQNVDCSIGGMPRLGPLFTDELLPDLPVAAEGDRREVRQFVRGPHGATDELFVLCDRYAYRRPPGGPWVLSHDFGAGNEAMQAVEFRRAGSAGVLWVATSLGQLWAYDGAAWIQALLGGAWAERVEAVADSLYVGAGSEVRVSNDGDPLLAASWGGAIRVGNAATRISGLRALGDTLFIFKWDGILTLNADGSDNDLFPELRAGERVSNGAAAVPWRDALWLTYGDDFYALSREAALRPVGPELLTENASPVRGRIASASPHGSWFLYAVLYNAADPCSYLVKYGTWTPGASRSSVLSEVWHGALASWPDRRATRVDVVSFDTELDPTADGPALWVGFDDGGVAFTPLPSGTPDPTLDSACRFAPAGQIWWPLHDAVFGADAKAFHGATALGPVLTTGQFARLYWRVDPAVGYAPLSPLFTANGQRVEFPDLTTGAARDAATGVQLDAYTELVTLDPTLSPVLEGVALHEAVRPAAGDPVARLSWTATVDARNRVVRRDGVVSRGTAEQILQRARAAATAAGHVRVRMPDGTIAGVAAIDYSQSLAPEDGRDGLAHAISVRFTQFR